MELKRTPYQAAQTSMERHVVGLVEHLENGRDSRGGFNQSIEAAQAHAFWLETRCIELSQEVRRLEMALMPSLPTIKMFSETTDTRDPSSYYPMRGGAIVFDWGMEQIRYRGVWRDADDPDEHTARQVKRRAYREILGRFRKEFEKTWNINFSRRQRERAS